MVTGRSRWLFGVMIALGLTLMTCAPALAECNSQPNRWPKFSDVAPSADRIVVGTVTEAAGFAQPPVLGAFVVRVDEVLRGSAPETTEISVLRSGLPLTGPSSCQGSALLYTRIGDVVAFAFGGQVPGVAGEVNTAAWIEGRPHSLLVPGPERLTIDEVRYYSRLPDTSTGPGASLPAPQDPSGANTILLLAAALGALAIGWRLRKSSESA